MLLVKEKFLPVCKWELGRISGIYTGSNDMIKVVKVHAKSDKLKRLISK